MSEVTPISASICHVDVEYGDAKAEIILVKDSFKLWVQKFRTLGEAESAPWIKRAALELKDIVLIGCCGAISEACLTSTIAYGVEGLCSS